MRKFPLTWLYVPGDRPEVVTKALAAGADVVIIDLEDAVSPDRKDYARAATAERLSDPHAHRIHVRVNAPDTPWSRADLAALSPLPGVSALRLPKVTTPRDITATTGLLSREIPLYALLESALAIENAYAIATAHPALAGLALGEADLKADLNTTSDASLAYPRSRTILAARAAALPPPPQSVHTNTRDLTALAATSAAGRALGFLGRAAIHPRQLPVIERAYLPTEEEIEKAESIVKAAEANEGAQALPDGTFIDRAILEAAHRTLSLITR
ncbi:CoA ester lyase [Streptomyces niveiscabiei]|uniref:HpcH/HpaI aldolase/citrate lyase family protein n=1 Tax=Streptomyces niveiscabiei TaxID=164115 RepID=UPI0029B20343|nr:CoA ester lyase [Streptomyces niveiscabiei]MDX3381311.1 CoA ester lyase [Streptomyces niveiscabiei]